MQIAEMKQRLANCRGDKHFARRQVFFFMFLKKKKTSRIIPGLQKYVLHMRNKMLKSSPYKVGRPPPSVSLTVKRPFF